MTTKTLFSNKQRKQSSIRNRTLYRQGIREGLGLGLLSAALGFIALILPTLVHHSKTRNVSSNYHWFRGVFLSSEQYILTMIGTALLTIAVAFFYNRHLFSKTASDFYHSQPETRVQLLNMRAFAGLTWVLVPFVVLYILTFILQLLLFGNTGSLLTSEFLLTSLLDFTSMILYQLSIYWFITACVLQTGTAIQGVTLAGFGGFFLLGISLAVIVLQDTFLYGAASSSRFLFFLSPYTYIFYPEILFQRGSPNSLGIWFLVMGYGVLLILLWYGISRYSYRKRQNEITGESEIVGPSVRIMESFVVFIVAFVALLLLLESSSLALSFSLALVFGIVGGILLDLVISRGQIQWKKMLRWVGGASVAFALLFAFFLIDPFHYTTKVPLIEDVASVQISSSPYARAYIAYPSDDFQLTAPEAIEEVIQTHQMIVDHAPKATQEPSPLYMQHWFTIEYRLNNGRTFTRFYDTIHHSAAAQFLNLATVPAYHQQFHLLNYLKSQGADLTRLFETFTLSDNLSQKTVSLSLGAEEKTQLLEALLTDISNTRSLEVLEEPGELLLTLPYRHDVYSDYREIYPELTGTILTICGKSSPLPPLMRTHCPY